MADIMAQDMMGIKPMPKSLPGKGNVKDAFVDSLGNKTGC